MQAAESKDDLRRAEPESDRLLLLIILLSGTCRAFERLKRARKS